MNRTPARAALSTVTDAMALLTYDVCALPEDLPLSALGLRVRQLQRALARLETLSAMHPDLTIHDLLPLGAIPPEALVIAQDQVLELEKLVNFRPTPAVITLTADVPDDAPQLAHDVAKLLTGKRVVLSADPTEGPDGRHVAHVGALLTKAVAASLPDDPRGSSCEDATSSSSRSDSAQALWRHFGPRSGQEEGA